jgi:hypothetical protein
MRNDDDDVPLYLGVGACHELAAPAKGRRLRRKEPIGFVHFGRPKPVTSARSTSRKPQARRRKTSR